MKYTTLFLATLILLVSSNFLSAQIEKTLVKAFNIDGNNIVEMDVSEKSNVVVHKWGEDQMRVIMTVSLENGSDMMLKSLVKVGRYNLDGSDESGLFRVFLPELMKEVKLRSGNKLIENIDFEVFVPSDVQVKTNQLSDALAEETNSDF